MNVYELRETIHNKMRKKSIDEISRQKEVDRQQYLMANLDLLTKSFQQNKLLN